MNNHLHTRYANKSTAICTHIQTSGVQRESIKIPVQCKTSPCLLWYANRYNATPPEAGVNQGRINKPNYLTLFKLNQRQPRPYSPVHLPNRIAKCPVILFISVMHPFSHRVYRHPLQHGPHCAPPPPASDTHKHTLLIIWGCCWLKFTGCRIHGPFFHPSISSRNLKIHLVFWDHSTCKNDVNEYVNYLWRWRSQCCTSCSAFQCKGHVKFFCLFEVVIFK